MITIKTPEEQDKMRVAGRLAASVLDMIAPHVQPGVATEELDRLCHEYIVGEIGGSMEDEAAEYAKTMTKPVIAYIAGGAAPPGKKMGHAGAIVTGDKGSYASKRSALDAAGVTVLDTPSDAGAALKSRLGR